MPRGRPKKYHSEQQRRAAKTAQIRAAAARRTKRLAGRYFRLVVPALAGYQPGWKWQSERIRELRGHAVDLLVAHERSRGLQSYLVAVERHAGSGLPHLDILMVYSKKVQNPLNRYDYLVKHGDLTRYRTVNAAILDYGRKEDPSPLGNLDAARVIAESRVRTELYTMMKQAMLRDPFKFDPISWLADTGLDDAAVRTNVYKTIRMVKDLQNRECNLRLAMRTGIREITPELIRQRLNAEELQRYRSWPGYATIVDHLNQIPRYGFKKPHKSQSVVASEYKNLYICGRPGIGKTALTMQVQKHCPVYPLGTHGGWFPAFQSGVYKLLVWDQFSLSVYPYPDLLKLLEGRPMKLPQKGGHVQRADRQLVVMSSNLTLTQHINRRFYRADDRSTSELNLRERVTEVIIPEGLDLFILLKLINTVEN